MGSLIDCDDLRCVVVNRRSDWNTYRRKISDLNRSRDSEIMGGLLDNNKSISKERRTKLDTHTVASGDLCGCSLNRIGVTNRNG